MALLERASPDPRAGARRRSSVNAAASAVELGQPRFRVLVPFGNLERGLGIAPSVSSVSRPWPYPLAPSWPWAFPTWPGTRRPGAARARRSSSRPRRAPAAAKASSATWCGPRRVLVPFPTRCPPPRLAHLLELCRVSAMSRSRLSSASFWARARMSSASAVPRRVTASRSVAASHVPARAASASRSACSMRSRRCAEVARQVAQARDTTPRPGRPGSSPQRPGSRRR